MVQDAIFSLPIDGKKRLLRPEAPSTVAASLEHPEWEPPAGARPEVGVGGNTGVVWGGPPRNTKPFPGSQPPGTPPPPRVESPAELSGVGKEAVRADELLMETALVEGSHHSAVSCFLYFPFRGKIGSIKTFELLYGVAVLKLR